MKESDVDTGIEANSEKQGVDSGGSIVSSDPKGADEGVLTSPAPKRGGWEKGEKTGVSMGSAHR